MKSGLGFGVVAVGLVLLWLVVTGRTANFAQAWQDLKGGTVSGGMGQGAGAVPAPAPAPGASGGWPWNRLFDPGSTPVRPVTPAPVTPTPATWTTPTFPRGFGGVGTA